MKTITVGEGSGDNMAVMCLLASTRPEVDPQDPHTKPGVLAHACNPSAGKVETGGFPGAHLGATLAYLESFSPVKNLTSNKEKSVQCQRNDT